MLEESPRSNNAQNDSVLADAGYTTAVGVVLALAAKVSGLVGIPAALLAIVGIVAYYQEWANARKNHQPTLGAQAKFYGSVVALGLALGEILLMTGVLSAATPFLMPALLISAFGVMAIVGIITLVQKLRSRNIVHEIPLEDLTKSTSSSPNAVVSQNNLTQEQVSKDDVKTTYQTVLGSIPIGQTQPENSLNVGEDKNGSSIDVGTHSSFFYDDEDVKIVKHTKGQKNNSTAE